MLTDQIAVVLLVTDVLEIQGVPYVIGGSFASALHGVMRATMDADVVADLHLVKVGPLAEALSRAFYINVEAMKGAIRRRSSFNLIHLETAFKVDVFVARQREFDRAQLARRQMHLLSENPEQNAYVATAEDIVLAKLEWYLRGGEVSSAQWRDVLGVLKVQSGKLDQSYMSRMAAGLGVSDLLHRAIDEAR